MSTPPPPSVLPKAWTDVLDEVLQALDDTAKEAARRAQSLEAPAAASGPDTAALPALGAWPQRLAQLRAPVDQAGRAVAEADAVLAADEEAVKEWLAKATATARTLADGVGGAV
jgi:hypothetical protein